MCVCIYCVCQGSSDPFYIVTYYINGSLLPGHTVPSYIISYTYLIHIPLNYLCNLFLNC